MNGYALRLPRYDIATGSFVDMPEAGPSWVDRFVVGPLEPIPASPSHPSLLDSRSRKPLLNNASTQLVLSQPGASEMSHASEGASRMHERGGLPGLAGLSSPGPVRSTNRYHDHHQAGAGSYAVRPSSHPRRGPYDRADPLAVEEEYQDLVTPAVHPVPSVRRSPNPAYALHKASVRHGVDHHPSKDIPSFVPLSTGEFRFAYVRPAQLPPPGPLLIDGCALDRPLPLLPPLEEPEFAMVFTHTSWASTKKRAFARPDGDAIYDLEQSEHLGDAMLSLMITELILDMFPRVVPGGASVMRANLVNNNRALASISTAYHLHTQLRAAPNVVLSLKLQPKIRGQLFESYLAAIVKQYGYPFARAWVRELMAPIAIACYKTLKEKAAEDAKPKPGSADRFGYVTELIDWANENALAAEWVAHETKRDHNNRAVYSVTLRVEKSPCSRAQEEEGWFYFGPRDASQQKVAKNDAAYAACRFLDIPGRPASPSKDPSSSHSRSKIYFDRDAMAQ